jgi:hypothetical protein
MILLKKIFIVLLVASCGLTTVRPRLEMSLSGAAFMAAKKANAHEAAPTLYRKAEHYYLKAKSYYRRKYFNKAKKYFLASKKLSERAEYIAKRKETLKNL